MPLDAKRLLRARFPDKLDLIDDYLDEVENQYDTVWDKVGTIEELMDDFRTYASS